MVLLVTPCAPPVLGGSSEFVLTLLIIKWLCCACLETASLHA